MLTRPEIKSLLRKHLLTDDDDDDDFIVFICSDVN